MTSLPPSPHRPSAASSSFHAAAPWTPPPPSPMPWRPQRSPPNNIPPLQSAIVTPPSLPVMVAMKAPITAATCPSRSPPPPSDPYKRVSPLPSLHRTHSHYPPLLSKLWCHPPLSFAAAATSSSLRRLLTTIQAPVSGPSVAPHHPLRLATLTASRHGR
jgi:hypothetical protein